MMWFLFLRTRAMLVQRKFQISWTLVRITWTGWIPRLVASNSTFSSRWMMNQRDSAIVEKSFHGCIDKD